MWRFKGRNGDVGVEGNSGSEGEWSEMVRACVMEGWWACFEESVGVWSEGARESENDQRVGLEKEDALNRAR